MFADEKRSTEGHIEELIVTGERFEIDTSLAFERLTVANDKGARLYKNGKYREALPYLLVGARTGFKMSQARVGTIYLKGLGNVPKNVEKGLGWLGVASQPTTAPEIRRVWKQIMASVPEHQLPLVDEIVADYVDKYGIEATGTKCRMKSNTKSFIARLDCDLSDELLKFASVEQKQMITCVTSWDPYRCVGVGNFEHVYGEHMNNISGGGGPF